MRPAQAASRLIPAGIPADALLSAMTMHWPKDARQDAGISDFDFVALSQEIMRERDLIGKTDSKGHPFHKLFGYALVLAENRQPIMLVGPHGTGKSHIAHQISDFLGLDYGETPMTSGATRGDLLGRFTASPDRPFIAARFDEIYGKGGVFNFEEIDASDPSHRAK
jgi:MoxR-like ATPase